MQATTCRFYYSYIIIIIVFPFCHSRGVHLHVTPQFIIMPVRILPEFIESLLAEKKRS